jgi:hypothetical protein
MIQKVGVDGEVFPLEPRINEMEIVIDEHAIHCCGGGFSDDEMRLIVAALKITDLSESAIWQ